MYEYVSHSYRRLVNWCANVPKISGIHAVKANRNNSRERIFPLPWRSGVGNTLLFIERYQLGISTGERMTAATQPISTIEKLTV